jgi:hypothetical protein
MELSVIVMAIITNVELNYIVVVRSFPECGPDLSVATGRRVALRRRVDDSLDPLGAG